MPDTNTDQLRRLRSGPDEDESPGGLGLMSATVRCPEKQARAVLQKSRQRLAAHLQGEALSPDLDLDADWALWSLTLDDADTLRLELVIFGFPVSGFSGLRRFFLGCGATSLEQRRSS